MSAFTAKSTDAGTAPARRLPRSASGLIGGVLVTLVLLFVLVGPLLWRVIRMRRT